MKTKALSEAHIVGAIHSLLDLQGSKSLARFKVKHGTIVEYRSVYLYFSSHVDLVSAYSCSLRNLNPQRHLVEVEKGCQIDSRYYLLISQHEPAKSLLQPSVKAAPRRALSYLTAVFKTGNHQRTEAKGQEGSVIE